MPAGQLKRHFLRGLAVLLPTILTIRIFVWGYKFIQENISVHINRGLVRLTILVGGYHNEAARESLNKFWVEGWGSITGFIVSLIVVCAVNGKKQEQVLLENI